MDNPPAPRAFFEAVLADHKPDAIICTTSAQTRDASNSTLIAVAREQGIPCLAALDHWKGLDRFFEGSAPAYFPDHLICIDDATTKALGKAGLDISHIDAVGHPGLEHIARDDLRTPKAPWRVLLISQPIVQGGAYHGIFDALIEGRRLIDRVAEILSTDTANGELQMSLRRHPKEHAGAALPSTISLDMHENWNTARAHYDVFVGFDSMALIEASLSGAPCVRLVLPEFAEISDQSVPLNYGVPTPYLKDLVDNIRAAVSQLDTPGPSPFVGATARAADIINTFVNSKL